MLKKIIYTFYARECLKNILLYISKDSVKRGNIFIDRIISEIKNLEKYPNIGVEIEKGIRKLVINKNYVVRYKIRDNEIYILSVINVKLK